LLLPRTARRGNAHRLRPPLIVLQAFTFAQVRAPSAGILVLPHSRRGLRDAENHWATPLVDVRRMLGAPTNPALVGGYTVDLLGARKAA
jgi:hypothetical protein